MSRPSLPIAVALAALLGLGAAGCADTPQPPGASGAGGAGTVPTGTAPASPTATGTPTEEPASETSTPVSSSSSSTKKSSPKPTAISGGQAKAWPGVPAPEGSVVLDTSGKDDGYDTWTRSYRTEGSNPRRLADGLKKQYEAAGYDIKQQTDIPGSAGGGRVFTADNDKYNVSVVVNSSSSDGKGVIGTTINVAEL